MLRKYDKNFYIYIGILLGLFIILGILWPYFAEYSLSEKTQYASFLKDYGVLLTAIVGGPIGLYLAYMRSMALHRASTIAERKETREEKLDRDTHLAELFSKAIEHLGSSELAVRLGGIYALEKLALRSPEDHPRVMEILAAFVRSKCGIKGQQTLQITPEQGGHRESDVQAIITVIGRRNITNDDKTINFRRCDFSGAHFHGSYVNCTFFDCDFNGTWMMFCDCTGSNFLYARFDDASLNDSIFTNANFQNAELVNCHLEKAVFKNANMKEANFQGAFLEATNLIGANLNDAKSLTNEQLKTSSFDATTLHNINS